MITDMFLLSWYRSNNMTSASVKQEVLPFRNTRVHPQDIMGSVLIYLVFCILLYRPLFVFLLLSFCHCIVCLFIPFDIFKPFLEYIMNGQQISFLQVKHGLETMFSCTRGEHNNYIFFYNMELEFFNQ